MLPGKFEIDFPPMALITKINYGNLLPGKTHFSLSTMFLIPGNKKRRFFFPQLSILLSSHETACACLTMRHESKVQQSVFKQTLLTSRPAFVSTALSRLFVKKNEAAPLLDTEIMTKASAPFIK